MTLNKISPPKKRKGLGSRYALLAIGIGVIALAVWQFYKYKIVNRQVNKAVTEKSKGLYSISYEDLVIDEVGGSLHVKNIRILPDTAVYRRMVAEKTNPAALISLTIPALEITGVKTPKALLNKEIEGRRIKISNPTIEIMLSHFKKDTTVYNPARDISKQLLGKLLKIKIDSVEVVHANVVVRNMGAREAMFSGKNISCLFSGLLIDSIADKDSSRILFSRDLEVGCDEIVLPSKNKKYGLHISDLRFKSQDNSFYIGLLRLTPKLSEEEFARSFSTQKDRYNFSFEGISLRHINREAIWHKRLEADSLVIQKSSFKIYHDLSLPRDTASKVGKYPQQQLMRLPVPVNIRKMIFVHSFIEYKEKNAKSDSAGKVQFFDVAGTISNITNIKKDISRDNKCIVTFKAKFLNTAPVDARLVMLLKDPHGKFSIKGNVGAIEAPALNVLTQPMALARMERGHIDNLHFNFIGMDSFSTGKLVMRYDDLKISLLKKDKEKNKYDKKGLASLAANIIMKRSNPIKGGETRIVDVHFQRFLNRSFFNLIWKTIFTGAKKTAGMK